jgi:formate dehydrogenase iron-sulfur subunit
VAYDARLCLGCRYCMVACPFGVPRYEWASTVPAVRKCDMCVERAALGQLPACVEACPAEATIAGDRDELLAEAHRRIAENPAAYYPHVYGESEAGGTCVLFLSPVSFEQLGFQQGLPSGPLPDLTWRALEKVPGVVTMGGAALMAVWWITNRREEVARAAAQAAEQGGTHEEDDNA